MKLSASETETQVNQKHSTIESREICPGNVSYDILSGAHLDNHAKMDFKELLNKPIFIQNFTWTNTDPIGTNFALAIPSSFLSNELLAIPFKTACKYRLNMKLILQVKF